MISSNNNNNNNGTNSEQQIDSLANNLDELNIKYSTNTNSPIITASIFKKKRKNAFVSFKKKSNTNKEQLTPSALPLVASAASESIIPSSSSVAHPNKNVKIKKNQSLDNTTNTNITANFIRNLSNKFRSKRRHTTSLSELNNNNNNRNVNRLENQNSISANNHVLYLEPNNENESSRSQSTSTLASNLTINDSNKDIASSDQMVPFCNRLCDIDDEGETRNILEESVNDLTNRDQAILARHEFNDHNFHNFSSLNFYKQCNVGFGLVLGALGLSGLFFLN